MSDKPFELPEIKDRAGVRWTERDKQNLRLIMADRQVSNVSDIIKWCVEQQAKPVRQRWQEAADRRAKEGRDV